jgi:hypothetical protein
LLGRMDVVDAVNQWWPRGIDVDGWTDRRVDLTALMGIDAMFTLFFFPEIVFDIMLYIQFLFVLFYIRGTVPLSHFLLPLCHTYNLLHDPHFLLKS